MGLRPMAKANLISLQQILSINHSQKCRFVSVFTLNVFFRVHQMGLGWILCIIYTLKSNIIVYESHTLRRILYAGVGVDIVHNIHSLSASHTGLTTMLRPSCDLKMLESWANSRLIARLVAEVLGDRG